MEERGQLVTSLYLFELMVVGKSHFVRIVSDALKCQVLVTDDVIENNEETTISQIFKYQVEDYFRKLERDLIESGLPSEASVVACGGGLATQDGMMDTLQSKGVVIALFASKEPILERTSRHKHRPL